MCHIVCVLLGDGCELVLPGQGREQTLREKLRGTSEGSSLKLRLAKG